MLPKQNAAGSNPAYGFKGLMMKVSKPAGMLEEMLKLEGEGRINAMYSFCYEWMNDGFHAGRFTEADEVLRLAAHTDLTKQLLTALVSFSMTAYREGRLPGMLVLLEKHKEKLKTVFPELYDKIDAAVA